MERLRRINYIEFEGKRDKISTPLLSQGQAPKMKKTNIKMQNDPDEIAETASHGASKQIFVGRENIKILTTDYADYSDF